MLLILASHRFQNGDRRKILHFVCEPGIDESNTVIQSAIEQAKLKFNIHTKSSDSEGARTRDTDFLSDSVTESLAEMSELEETLANEKTTSGKVTYYWSLLSYIYRPLFG